MSEQNLPSLPSPGQHELDAPEVLTKRGAYYNVTPFKFSPPGEQLEETIENVIIFDSL